MLQNNELVGRISAKENINAKLNNKEIQVYPELENLVVTPSGEQQTFKSNKYGYDEVIVEAVESKEIKIIPSTEEQVKEGMFNKVTVAGDSDLIPENIKEGTEIFGVQGNAKTTDLKITDASYLFYGGARLNDKDEILKFVKNCTNTKYMFASCGNLKILDVSNINTSQVTNMSNMFYYCLRLTSLDVSNFDTNQVTVMSSMFHNCSELTSLDVSNFDTGNVTEMSQMFSNCSKLTSIDVSKFNTGNVTDMYAMFMYCYELTTLDLSDFDTSNTTNMGSLVNSCKKLTSLNLNGLKMDKVNNVSYMFNYCEALSELNWGINLGKGYTQKSNNYSNYKLDLSKSPLLTHDSLMSVINNLYDLNLTYNVANGGTLYRQSLVLGETNLAKLTEEEIAIATAKGWNVS